MSLLGLGLEILLLVSIFQRFRKTISRQLERVSIAVATKKELLEVIEERLQFTQELNVKFSGSLDLELMLYEVAKELSKFIEEDDIVHTFIEKVSAVFHSLGCKVIEASDLERYRNGYAHFKITADDQKAKYFVVNQDAYRAERAKITVMVNQLQLFLKRSRLYAEIQELSITDGLTGGFVRRYFLERLHQEMLRSRHNNLRLSLLLIDVDNFKAFNDTYGHITGDAVLKEVVKMMQSSLRQIDMCARYGGEEFCIMLPETNREGAYLAAQRLRACVEEAELTVFDEVLKCTISIGVAVFPDDAEGINGLIDKADKALYKAKTQGRNRVC